MSKECKQARNAVLSTILILAVVIIIMSILK